jgi:hypothetical protein
MDAKLNGEKSYLPQHNHVPGDFRGGVNIARDFTSECADSAGETQANAIR